MTDGLPLQLIIKIRMYASLGPSVNRVLMGSHPTWVQTNLATFQMADHVCYYYSDSTQHISCMPMLAAYSNVQRQCQGKADADIIHA
jgi:hypothetical protein